MGERLGDLAPENTFATNRDGVPPELIAGLLGPRPETKWGRAREDRARQPEKWPSDKADREYLHRGLVRRLAQDGGTAAAAAAIRRDLEAGVIGAVVIDDNTGAEHQLPPRLWLGASVSADMYWTGRVIGSDKSGRYEGEVYLITSRAGTAKLPDMEDSEALCKLLLHLAGKKSAAQIADQSTGTDFQVPQRTVSYFLKKARDQLAEKTK